MKNSILLFHLLLLSVGVFAQNLVINPSFENYTSCPPGGIQISNSTNWYAYRWSPDYFNSCTSNSACSVPINAYGYQFAATGGAYSGLFCYGANGNDTTLREYLGAQLSNQLIIGQKYYVSLKVNCSNNPNMNCRTNKLGALFSTVSFRNLSDGNLNVVNPTPIKNYAHIYTTSVISDTVNWTTISGSFIADSTYNYIIIGNFFDNQQTSHTKIDNSPSCLAYYFVDDICVSTDSMTCMGSTGINEHELSAQLIIYPNPSASAFNIQLPTHHSFALSIIDITGRAVYMNKNATGTVAIDVNGFSSGVYYVKAVNEKTVLTGKLIKE